MERRSKDRRRRASNVADDRLSKLPDDVLLEIMERMDMITAIRACIVSKRMLKLPTKFSRVDIDMARIGADAVANVTERLTSARMNPEAVPIRDLRVAFVLRHPDCVSIGGCVARAMAAGKVVGAAEFDIVTEKASCVHNRVAVPLGDQFSRFLGSCPGAFAGLMRLSLGDMMFSDSDVPGILAACGRLESLRFDLGIGDVLRVEHARLVELDIAMGLFERVELGRLPMLRRVRYNMTRLAFIGPRMSFGFAPQLSELSIAVDWTPWGDGKPLELSQLLVNSPSVSDLHLDFRHSTIWVVPECPQRLAPVLHKLHVLTLDNLPQGHDIAWTMFFLEAAPNLKDLRIKMSVWGYYDHIKDVEWKPSMSNFRHKNLAKLTIYGFQANAIFLGYIRHVRKAAVNINQVSLVDKEGRIYNPKTFEISMGRQGEEQGSARSGLEDRDALLQLRTQRPIGKGVRGCSLQVMCGCLLFVLVLAACLFGRFAGLTGMWGLGA